MDREFASLMRCILKDIEKVNKSRHLRLENTFPFLSPDEDYDSYYNRISNDVLWPLFHYEAHLVNFSWKDWEIYKKDKSGIFAEKIAEVVRDEDLIWIHDFHLLLLPKYLKYLGVQSPKAFFLHIPFPSSEIFRQLPIDKEILEGVLEADLIGFHEHSYLRHFRNSIQAVIGIDSTLFHTEYHGKDVTLGVFPVSIDTNHFIRKKQTNKVKKNDSTVKVRKEL